MCIKIPATPESVLACKYLESIGIRTLSTCLFSVQQAMAAHQAGCLYIAPYFNGMSSLTPPPHHALIAIRYITRLNVSRSLELRVHFEPGVWKEYADTAKEHPAGPVVASIVKLYKEVGAKTLVMPAR